MTTSTEHAAASGGTVKGKKAAKKAGKRRKQPAEGKPSLLRRLFGLGAKSASGQARQSAAPGPPPAPGSRSASAPPPAADPAPPRRVLTPRERSVAEIKQMAGIGKKDPERLARLLAGLLAKERKLRQAEKERFEEQVLEIARRTGQEAEPGPPAALPPPTGAPSAADDRPPAARPPASGPGPARPDPAT